MMQPLRPERGPCPCQDQATGSTLRAFPPTTVQEDRTPEPLGSNRPPHDSVALVPQRDGLS